MEEKNLDAINGEGYDCCDYRVLFTVLIEFYFVRNEVLCYYESYELK